MKRLIQFFILWVGVLLITLMCLFPPEPTLTVWPTENRLFALADLIGNRIAPDWPKTGDAILLDREELRRAFEPVQIKAPANTKKRADSARLEELEKAFALDEFLDRLEAETAREAARRSAKIGLYNAIKSSITQIEAEGLAVVNLRLLAVRCFVVAMITASTIVSLNYLPGPRRKEPKEQA
ncbi:MAG: hypothetical protein QF662_01365 [Phycisphaerae bacterium]|nr:hypothetical protein [Phycisphaerae bacterium]